MKAQIESRYRNTSLNPLRRPLRALRLFHHPKLLNYLFSLVPAEIPYIHVHYLSHPNLQVMMNSWKISFFFCWPKQCSSLKKNLFFLISQLYELPSLEIYVTYYPNDNYLKCQHDYYRLENCQSYINLDSKYKFSGCTSLVFEKKLQCRNHDRVDK